MLPLESVTVVFNFHLAFDSSTRYGRPSIYWGRKSLKVAAVERGTRVCRQGHLLAKQAGRVCRPKLNSFFSVPKAGFEAGSASFAAKGVLAVGEGTGKRPC